MWKNKYFRTKESMNNWLQKNKNKIQYNELFVNNAYGIEYRKLIKIL